MRHLMRAADLTDGEVDRLIARADVLSRTGRPTPRPFILGSLFLTSSMRTRIGFQAAALRLGGGTVSVDELRVDARMSSAEPYEDALRVLSGMADVVVTRTPFTVDPTWLAQARCPVVNGGDDVEHPTQALIDLAAISRFRGTGQPQEDNNLGQLRLGLCGDLTMRSATSLLALLARRPPQTLTLIYPDGRAPVLPESLRQLVQRADLDACANLDVLVMVGLPPGTGSQRLDDEARRPYVLTQRLIATMPPDAIVLNPMPMIDEIAPQAKHDPRVRMFDQSDHGLYVRMAALELMLNG